MPTTSSVIAPQRSLADSSLRWRLSSTPNNDNNNDPADKDPKDDNNKAYDELYEFLTKRTGGEESAGATERRRKRDRILDWMKSSSGDNMVQPINMEDGSVMETPPLQTQARFEKLFKGMPTLEEFLTSSKTSASTSPAATSAQPQPLKDDSWFDAEAQQITQDYEQILEDMKGQIQQLRQETPDEIPDNAEGVVESIIEQEKKR